MGSTKTAPNGKIVDRALIWIKPAVPGPLILPDLVCSKATGPFLANEVSNWRFRGIR